MSPRAPRSDPAPLTLSDTVNDTPPRRHRRGTPVVYSAQEEHAKAKKGRERRKAEAEAKAAAEEKDAEAVPAGPDLAKPISSLTTA